MAVLTMTSYRDKGASALGVFLWITMHTGQIEAILCFGPKKEFRLNSCFIIVYPTLPHP